MRMRRPSPLPAPRAWAGFSLVELAVVLSVLGVLTLTAMSAFDNLGQMRQHNAARAHAEAARQAVLAFALRNKRLPCPDTSANGDSGREGGGAGCTSTTRNIGWLPYESLGLDLPAREQRLRYGVHRTLHAITASSADQPDLERNGGFGRALANLAAASADTGQPHYANDGTPTACTGAGSQVSNPAFVLVAPASDRDGDGSGFDGPHRNFIAAGNTCVLPPDYPAGSDYDDVVVVQSPSTLLGWLMSVTR